MVNLRDVDRLRNELHGMVDALPDQALPFAQTALVECRNQWSRDITVSSLTRVDHLAMWVTDLARARAFYERWFHAMPGAIYSSSHRPFRSYFMTFGQGARLELMTTPGEPPRLAHIALATGSRDAVDLLFKRMKADGIQTLSEPRQTGDGYYEAVVGDSEGNLVEITV